MPVKNIYREAVSKRWRENIRAVPELLDAKDKDLLFKIERAAQRWNIPEAEIRDSIRSNKVAAACFAIDPIKQGIHEKVAAAYICKLEGVSDFGNLPATKLYLMRGNPIPREELKGYPDALKIDFYWEYKNFEIYAKHKYTDQSGGSQNNQCKVLRDFIMQCVGSKTPKRKFIVIADGPYYRGYNARVRMTQMDNLRSICTSDTKVCAIDELKKVLDEL